MITQTPRLSARDKSEIQREWLALECGDTFKQVSWSYPTSDNARKFGFRRGCWSVGTVTGNGLPKYLAGYATAIEATNAADLLPYPWSRWSVQNRRDVYGASNEALSGASVEQIACG